MNLQAILEGLLFVVGDEGLTIKDICNILKIDEEEAKKVLKKLQDDYENDFRGIRISYLGESFKLTTKKEHKEYYENLIQKKDNSLSQSQLEVLAIIAYNEPITRIEIDEIRGINSTYIIKKLLAKDLIKISGKSDLPGRPNMYKTTKEFLDCFGLSSMSDLPDILPDKLEEDINLFSKKS